MCKRLKEPYKGKFNLVGGKLENSENEYDAAYRELNEETGITCEGTAVRQNQAYIAADGDGLVNGDGAADRVPARSPFYCLGAVFNQGWKWRQQRHHRDLRRHDHRQQRRRK